MPEYIGIDVGRRSIDYIYENDGETVKHEVRTEKKDLESQMRAILEKHLKGQAYTGIGFSIPGVIDSDEKKLRYANAFEKMNLSNVADGLGPIEIANDTDAAALAEYGTQENESSDLLFLMYGSGIGGGIISGGEIQTYQKGFSLEPYCVEVDEEIFEHFAGGDFIAQWASKESEVKIKSAKRFFEIKNEIPDTWDKWIEMNARALRTILSIVPVGKVVFGGAVMSGKSEVIKEIERVQKKEYPTAQQQAGLDTTFQMTRYPENSSVRGALELAKRAGE